ncbi:YdcF family protein [Pseudomonas sp. MN1F]|uniref:YdcF family protein n=1 Tax=Pseudomonas sp. MN1F TaxID=1366632 RepID=UPI00128F77DB|nr:YdcF family protein [Pseudomonas sp. MN1F]
MEQKSSDPIQNYVAILDRSPVAHGRKITLREDQLLRINTAIAFFHKLPNSKRIITTGRGQTPPITNADRCAKYIITNNLALRETILVEPWSYDTIGNIFYLSLGLLRSLESGSKLTIVTSSYHLARVQELVLRIFNKHINVNILDSGNPSDEDIAERSYNEMISIKALRKLLLGVDPGDRNEIAHRLSSSHSLYMHLSEQKIIDVEAFRTCI